jgi:hypothetical protein
MFENLFPIAFPDNYRHCRSKPDFVRGREILETMQDGTFEILIVTDCLAARILRRPEVTG